MQTAKASRKQSSLSGKESAQGCLPKRFLGRPDEALGGGNHLEKEMTTHSGNLAWEIPWTEKPGGL